MNLHTLKQNGTGCYFTARYCNCYFSGIGIGGKEFYFYPLYLNPTLYRQAAYFIFYGYIIFYLYFFLTEYAVS